MSHRLARPRRTAAAVAALAVVLTFAAGCGSDDSSGGAAGGSDTDVPAAAEGVPDECRVFPFAMPDPDLGGLELLPDDFPEPPVDATLCETGGTGGDQEYASYATSASEEEILAGYEEALAEHGGHRDQDGLGGPVVLATVDDVSVQVNIKDGGFSVVLARG